MTGHILKTKPSELRQIGVKRKVAWRSLREPLLTLLLIVQVFILFVIPSARAAGLQPPQIVIDAVLLIFIAMAIFLSRSRGAIAMLIVSTFLTAIGIVLYREEPNFLTDIISTAGRVLAQLSLIWAVSSAVFGPGRTTHHRILGAVVLYLSIGMIFASLDVLLARTTPAAFTHLPTGSSDLRETLTYFSFSTLTTGSFGDIVPVHPIARNLANLESIFGQLFPATLLARIVALRGSKKKDTDGL